MPLPKNLLDRSVSPSSRIEQLEDLANAFKHNEDTGGATPEEISNGLKLAKADLKAQLDEIAKNEASLQAFYERAHSW